MHPGVVVNWRIYGTSGFEQPPEGLVTENYLWRAADDYQSNCMVNSIVHPRSALGCAGPHHFRLSGDPVGEDRRRVQGALRGLPSSGGSPTVELLRINHYVSKSVAEFERKAAKPHAATGRHFARSPPPVDAVRDETVLQLGPQLREMLSSRAVHT